MKVTRATTLLSDILPDLGNTQKITTTLTYRYKINNNAFTNIYRILIDYCSNVDGDNKLRTVICQFKFIHRALTRPIYKYISAHGLHNLSKICWITNLPLETC